MPPVVIDNPILNSPFAEPARHFRFDDDGITSEIAEGRRRSTYLIPIPDQRHLREEHGGGEKPHPGERAHRRSSLARCGRPGIEETRRVRTGSPGPRGW